MLLTAFIISTLVAKILGGRLSRLGEIQYKHVDLLMMSVAIQLFLHASTFAGWYLSNKAIYAAIMASYALLSYSIYCNIRLPGAPLILGGVLANAVVILANGGKMPISRVVLEWEGSKRNLELLLAGGSPTHQLISNITRMSFLADIIPVAPPFWRPFVFSVGDVAIAIGLFVLVIKTTVSQRLESSKAG